MRITYACSSHYHHVFQSKICMYSLPFFTLVLFSLSHSILSFSRPLVLSSSRPLVLSSSRPLVLSSSRSLVLFLSSLLFSSLTSTYSSSPSQLATTKIYGFDTNLRDEGYYSLLESILSRCKQPTWKGIFFPLFTKHKTNEN
jgi:hypothetical protein